MFDRSTLLEQLGDPYTPHVVQRLHKFAFIPPNVVRELAEQALAEEWGRDCFVLKKYLAVHVAWSVEQGQFTHSANQLYTTAGHLQTRYGTPLYLVFDSNDRGDPPWRLVTAGSQISAPQLPVPPAIPEPPRIKIGSEVVMMHDHMLGHNTDRVQFLRETPPVAQVCAVSGAIQWSIYRGLQLSYWYYGKMKPT